MVVAVSVQVPPLGRVMVLHSNRNAATVLPQLKKSHALADMQSKLEQSWDICEESTVTTRLSGATVVVLEQL